MAVLPCMFYDPSPYELLDDAPNPRIHLPI